MRVWLPKHSLRLLKVVMSLQLSMYGGPSASSQDSMFQGRIGRHATPATSTTCQWRELLAVTCYLLLLVGTQAEAEGNHQFRDGRRLIWPLDALRAHPFVAGTRSVPHSFSMAFSRAGMLLAACSLFLPATYAAPIVEKTQCPNYGYYSQQRHEPFSPGAYSLSYMRPDPSCRTFNSSSVEDAITRMNGTIFDPDLYRLFENTYPSTLDTAIRWKGVAANNSDEELVFVITGDINAMWIRDSANQVAPYKTVLNSTISDVASIFRGVINLQARYLVQYPYCNSFNPPEESEIQFTANSAGYTVFPPYDAQVVFTCNFELDDFGGFLQLSHDYYHRTGDVAFFGKFQWIYAVQSILRASRAMQQPTYAANGTWLEPEYRFSSYTATSFGTLGNNGFSYPVNATGLVRAPFRPSDDAAVFDFGIAANMMLSRYLTSTAEIMERLPTAPSGLAQEMRDLADEIKQGIEDFGIVTAPNGKQIYAYEVDGFGGRNLMDDANVPSLLSAPFLGYTDVNETIYQNTRAFVLSRMNAWYCEGPVVNGIGSPHIRPGAAWPMSSIIRIFTSDDDEEITTQLREILRSTDGLGLIHESVDSWDAGRWTRQWFTWANSLFGQMILDLEERKPHLLKLSYQPGPVFGIAEGNATADGPGPASGGPR